MLNEELYSHGIQLIFLYLFTKLFCKVYYSLIRTICSSFTHHFLMSEEKSSRNSSVNKCRSTNCWILCPLQNTYHKTNKQQTRLTVRNTKYEPCHESLHSQTIPLSRKHAKIMIQHKWSKQTSKHCNESLTTVQKNNYPPGNHHASHFLKCPISRYWSPFTR